MSDTPRTDGINTSKRLFDLVRYMRSALHEGGLITDQEYAWLCFEAPMAHSESGDSQSSRRLEDYDDLITSKNQLERELNAANERIKRLEEAGDAMTFWCADEVSLEQWNNAKQ